MNWFIAQAQTAADEHRPWNWDDVRALAAEFEQHTAVETELRGAHDILDCHDVEKVDGNRKPLPLTARIHLLVAKVRGERVDRLEAARELEVVVADKAQVCATALTELAEQLRS